MQTSNSDSNSNFDSISNSNSNSIRIGGVQLEVAFIPASGRIADKAPLVFLHEGLGSVAMWRDWPARLCAATGRAGWVYSRRGYGQSDPVPIVRGPSGTLAGQRIGRLLPDYLHQEAFEVLPALQHALQIENPVLVGHSDGASIALLFASRFKLSACVAMAPHLVVEDVSIQSISQARMAFESGDLRSRLGRYHADVDCAFWQWNDVWLSDGFRTFDIRGDCQRISVPVLAIQGLDDVYGTMRQIDEISTQGLVTRHKLANCGHSAHRDQPALLIELITDFLQSVA